MNNDPTTAFFSAARLTAASFGFLAGIGGITHGVGEILQGNVRPEGLMIVSWAQGPIAEMMGGDPGMTIIPNLLVTGILAIVVSLALMIWALVFVSRKHGGVIMILLSVALMLTGGGFGSPIVGILAGIAAATLHAPLTWWRERFSGNAGRFLVRLWPLIFGAGLLNAVFLFIGAIVLVYVFRVGNDVLFLNSFYFTVLSLLLLIPTGIIYDRLSGKPVAAAERNWVQS